MSHTKDITRAEPGLLLFVVDHSGSMLEHIAGANVSKAQFVADAINHSIYQLTVKATRDESGTRPYFDIGVIGYGASIGSAFMGEFGDAVVHSLTDLASRPPKTERKLKREHDGAGGIIEIPVELPIWVEPRSAGGTPTAEALELAAQHAVTWISTHTKSFPPTVIHITDGEHSTADPSTIASAIRSLRTDDGEVLLFNIHVDTRQGASILFPSSTADLPDAASRKLFEMSSSPPAVMAQRIQREHQLPVNESTRFFGYRCDAVALIGLLSIGTPVAGGGDR